MGYTHYWTADRDFTPDEWERLQNYTRALLRKSPAQIAGPTGEGIPLLNSETISLNGAGNDAHETFYLPRTLRGYDKYARQTGLDFRAAAWTFCKTARKPYDAVVIRILAAANQIAPDNITPDSDGGEEVFSELGPLV